MVARAFDHGGRTGIAHGEALARHPAEKGFAFDRAVEHGIADDDVARRVATEIETGAHHHAAARQPLAGVVVGFTDEVERDAAGEESAEALAARAFHLDVDGVVGQAVMAIAPRHFAGKHGAHGAVDVARVLDELHFLAALQRGTGAFNQHMIERLGEAMILLFGLTARHVGRHIGLMEHAAEIEPARLPVLDALARVEQLGAADQIVELAHAELGHDGAHFLGDEEKEIHHMLGLARKLFAQRRVLRGHAHRAGVEVAFAHHDAALDHQRRGGEAEFVGAQQRADDHVAAGLDLAVHLHADAAAQAVEHQGLLGFGKTDFP